MKKNLFFKLIALAFVGVFIFKGIHVYSQDSSLQNTVLAYILPDSLEAPQNVKGQTPLSKVIIKSSSLLQNLFF